MAVDAQRRNVFLQVRREFDLAAVAILVRRVAGVAAHVERCVAAAVFGNIYADLVAGEAEILIVRRAAGWLQQLVRIVRLMRIVALDAIPNCRRMHRLCRVHLFFVVAAEAKRLGGGGLHLHPGDVAIDPNFVAAQASHRDRRVNRLTFGFIFVALEALRRVDILVERHWMSFGQGWRHRDGQRPNHKQKIGEGPSARLRASKVSIC